MKMQNAVMACETATQMFTLYKNWENDKNKQM